MYSKTQPYIINYMRPSFNLTIKKMNEYVSSLFDHRMAQLFIILVVVNSFSPLLVRS